VPSTGFDPRAHGFRFVFVYDSHHPDTEIVLGLEAGGRLWEASAGEDAWRGLFLQDYARERPPYIDLGAAKGIWVNSWTPTLGGNFVAQFTARNYGEYRAHLSELWLAVRGPAGENLDRFLGGDGDPTPLEPGEERAVFKASDGFGTIAGSYAVAAGYLSEQGCWLTIPGRAGGGRRGRRHRDPAAAPVAGHGDLPRGHRRGRRRLPRRRGPRPLPRPRRLGRRAAHLPQPPGRGGR
jgi:hypothetical protein